MILAGHREVSTLKQEGQDKAFLIIFLYVIVLRSIYIK